jgi:hypothetical protein
MNITSMPFAEMPENKIQSTSFYPELCIKELTDSYAIATQYATNVDMIIEKLSEATLFVNEELAEYQILNWHAYPKLENVPDVELDTISRLVILYKKAVYSLAKSKLLISKLGESHRDQQAAQHVSATENKDYWKKESFSAIRKILGISPNISVALI